jgi:hypothetical protein
MTVSEVTEWSKLEAWHRVTTFPLSSMSKTIVWATQAPTRLIFPSGMKKSKRTNRVYVLSSPHSSFIESAPHQQPRNYLKIIRKKKKIKWSRVPEGCLTPRQTGRLTVGRNIAGGISVPGGEKIREPGYPGWCSLNFETVKYGHESRGTRTRK